MAIDHGDHLDLEALSELEDIMEDEFCVLLETFLEDATLKLNQLDDALEQQDAVALRELAHSLKGASCNVGALPLSRLCETVEHLAKNAQLAELPPVLPGVHCEFSVVKTLLLERV